MDMHAAALPPRSGRHTKADRAHPLFPLYQQHLTSSARNLVDASDFRDWLFQHNAETERTAWTAHEQYPAFLAWCREEQAGRRPCCPSSDLPRGLAFPHNFAFWLEGGRW